MATKSQDRNVKTSVEELPESRVRVAAEVPPAEVERRVAQAAKTVGRSLRIPGFRQGKVPPAVVIQRVGREAVLDEAVRESLGTWYGAAIDAARIVPVGDPALDLPGLPAEGEPLRFTIEIGVRPRARLGEYRGLEVAKPEPEVSDGAVDAEIERIRERSGTLATVQRAAGEGDFVVMDYVGSIDGEQFAGGEGRDQMVELGSGRLVADFEDQLRGAAAGDERTVAIEFPPDYGAAHLAGQAAQFAVTVKEVKAKDLPAVDDDLAADAGFDTLDELKADIRERLGESERQRIEAEFREAVLDAAVAQASVDVPQALIEARSRELWEQMAHQLSHQGISKEAYLQIAQKSEEEVVEDGRADAERALRREAVLAAVAEAEGIAPTDEEVLEQIEDGAQRQGTTGRKLLDRLRQSGRLDALKDDLASSRALDLMVESAKPISPARAKIWTPGS